MAHPLKAILIDLIDSRLAPAESLDRLEELEDLVETYGGIVVVKAYQRRAAPHPKTYIGTGKAELLKEEGKEVGANLLIVNDRLKPRQTYDLAERLRPAGMQVWDRVDLILKIFAKHARTAEAKLEIELAAIRHMGPRVHGMGMELARQGGGASAIGGQGETNTELMKRHLAAREKTIKEKLARAHTVRAGNQAARRRKGLKTAAIVGYTNAGKTTLLNRLTGRTEYAANELFATLDTRVGAVYLPETASKILVSDTIGFIRNLPPDLLASFSSTLSEAVDADFLVHAVDASDKKALEHVAVVEDILARLGVADRPRLVALNKIDQAPKTRVATLKKDLEKEGRQVVLLSAQTGEGLDRLRNALGKALA